MASKAGHGPNVDHPLALREGGDRRHKKPRGFWRGRRERRKGQRRHHKLLGHALLATMTLGAPAAAHAKGRPTSSLSKSARKDEGLAASLRNPYEDLIVEAAKTHGLNARLIRAVVQVESAFNPMALSRTGAKGLMQLMPILARELRIRDPFDPRENIMGGARYLRRLLDRHDGDVRLALASYNAGPTNVERFGGVPPFKETQEYVERILGLLKEG